MDRKNNGTSPIVCGKIDACISTLSEKLAAGRLSVFCGAGISFQSGIMTVEPLIKYLLGFLSADQEDIEVYLKDKDGAFHLPIPFEAIIESLKENLQFKNSSREFIQSFAKLFEGRPNSYHHLLAHWLSSGKIKFIATTNFDTCLEQALGWEEGGSGTLIPYAESIESLKNMDISGKIIKLHGCKSKPEYLGTTVEQITRAEYWQKTITMLDKIFYEDNCDCVLFLGYSCSDMWDVVEYFDDCRLQDKNLAPCIYWQHSNESEVLLDGKPRRMLEAHPSFFFGGNTSELIDRLHGIENLKVEPASPEDTCKSLQGDIPDRTDYVLGHLFQDSHYYDLAIRYYERALRKCTKEAAETRITTLRELSSLYKSKNEFDKAEHLIVEAIELAYQLETDGIYYQIMDSVTRYADLLADTGRFKAAKNLYLQNIQEIEKTTQGMSGVAPLAILCNSFSLVLKQLQEYDSAQVYYRKALDIFQECAKERPQKYLPEVAMVLCNWAILLNEVEDFEAAGEFYARALDIRRKLAEINAIYLPDVATTLNNFAVSKLDQGDYASSVQLLEEALEIRRALAKISADIYLPYVATTLENLADAYLYLNNYAAARERCMEAVQIYRRFSRNDQSVYLEELANSLTDMSSILYSEHKIQEAQRYGKQAVQIRKRLISFNRNAYLPGLVKTSICLASISQETDADGETQKMYEKLAQLSEELIRCDRTRFLKQHAQILFNYANFNRKIHDLPAAKKLYCGSMELFRELSEKHPNIYLPDMGNILGQLYAIGEEQHETGDYINAKDTYETVLQMLRDIPLFESSAYAQKIINTLNILGIVYYELSDFDTAVERYQEAIHYNEQYIDENTEEYSSNQAMTFLNRGNAQAAVAEWKEAEVSYTKALGSFQVLAEQNPGKYLYDLSKAQYDISQLYWNHNDCGKAVSYLKNCVKIRRGLVEMDADTHFHALAKALDFLGYLYYCGGQGQRAEKCLAEILRRCEKLAAKNPEEYVFELAEYQISIAGFYQYKLVDKTKAMELAAKAIENLAMYRPCDEIQAALKEANAILQESEPEKL